jgi:hypothetical protein
MQSAWFGGSWEPDHAGGSGAIGGGAVAEFTGTYTAIPIGGVTAPAFYSGSKLSAGITVVVRGTTIDTHRDFFSTTAGRNCYDGARS